jgi:steroid 5-alpha reductase family enzyme
MIAALLISVLLSLCLQLSLWVYSVKTTNAGWVDFGWSAGMAISGLVILGTAPLSVRSVLVGVLFTGWALRLASHILFDRLLKGKPEDTRYQNLRANWGDRANAYFLWFFLGQALLVGIFMLPALTVAYRTDAAPDVFDLLGIAVALLAIGGESLSDHQLAGFRKDPSTKGQVCRRGFWKYSRHPNYFFEWLHWWGYVLMAIGSPQWFLTLVGPVLMYIFLRYVTGVPHAERQSLSSRGDAYREYQKTTPVFFPWKPQES